MEWVVNNLGLLVTLAGLAFSTAVTIAVVRNDVKHLDGKFGRLEKEVNNLRDEVIDLAKQEGRVHALEQTLILMGQRLDAVSVRIDRMLMKEIDG